MSQLRFGNAHALPTELDTLVGRPNLLSYRALFDTETLLLACHVRNTIDTLNIVTIVRKEITIISRMCVCAVVCQTCLFC